MIQVSCTNCGIRILVPTTVQGRAGICFGCGAPLSIPGLANANELIDLSFSPGTRIAGRYSIYERLGEGGMGVVYRALDGLVNEEIALKFMKPRLLRTQKGQMDFIKEAQIARRLRHDNIVAVHDIGWTEEGVLYLTMEFLRGQSLRAMLRKCRQDRRLIAVRVAVSLVGQVLAALEYAHRTVIHRDLKPENVMLLPGEHVKVLDFGLAKAVDEENAAGVGPQEGKRMAGTWAYASPEQKRRWAIDIRTDIYTVGLILRELFTLRTPVDPQMPVESVRDDLSPSVLSVLKTAIAEDREERWGSAREFRLKLSEAFEQSYRKIFISPVSTGGKTVSTDGMIYQEGGSFLMGCEDVQEEAPEREIYVEPFYIDKHPVTVAQYAKFIEAAGAPPPKFWGDAQFSGGDQPVVGVTWKEAAAYAAWAGKDLPSEAQWEFAARGKDNRTYPWGEFEPDFNRCNFGDYLGMPSIITMHGDGRTPEGVYDLAGNVYEWTRDRFVPYGQSVPANADEAPLFVARGGCWGSGAHSLRCTHRKGFFPEARTTVLGFRCVLAASQKP